MPPSMQAALANSGTQGAGGCAAPAPPAGHMPACACRRLSQPTAALTTTHACLHAVQRVQHACTSLAGHALPPLLCWPSPAVSRSPATCRGAGPQQPYGRHQHAAGPRPRAAAAARRAAGWAVRPQQQQRRRPRRQRRCRWPHCGARRLWPGRAAAAAAAARRSWWRWWPGLAQRCRPQRDVQPAGGRAGFLQRQQQQDERGAGGRGARGRCRRGPRRGRAGQPVLPAWQPQRPRQHARGGHAVHDATGGQGRGSRWDGVGAGLCV